MKCEVCLELLEEYLDGELLQPDHIEVGEHLIACSDCSESFAALTAEQELFARYDREIEVPPFLWTRIAAHTVAESNGATGNGWYRRVAAIFATPLASAIAVLLLAIAVGLVYVISRQPASKPEVAKEQKNPTLPRNGTDPTQSTESGDDHAATEDAERFKHCRVASKTKAPSQTSNQPLHHRSIGRLIFESRLPRYR